MTSKIQQICKYNFFCRVHKAVCREWETIQKCIEKLQTVQLFEKPIFVFET